MASILKKISPSGVVSYKASIVIKKQGEVVLRESKTFGKKGLASEWAKRREIELKDLEVGKARRKKTVAEVIQKYIDEFQPPGRTKSCDLRALMKTEIAKKNVHTLTHKDLVAHIRLRNESCQPQTAKNDLIWLKTVINTMRGVIDIGMDMSAFETARLILQQERLVGRSNRRTRRPTKTELVALSRYFHGTPMLHIIWFAIYSSRRQAEITRLEWDDVNHDKKTCLLKDMKDPRVKGKKAWFKIPKSAYKIIMRQPKTSRYIFPLNPKTIGSYFTRACHVLKIKDLHFHDLRHEATSRLSERGLTPVQIMQVTLHSSLSTLQIYMNLDPGDLEI